MIITLTNENQGSGRTLQQIGQASRRDNYKECKKNSIVEGDSELCQKVFASWSFFPCFPLKSIMWRKLDIDPALAWRHSVAAGTRFKVTRTSGSVQGDSQEVDTNLRWVHSI